MNTSILIRSIALCTFLIFSSCQEKVRRKISLAGPWQVRLDSASVGEKQQWANRLDSDLTISLPGTLDDAGIGKAYDEVPALDNNTLASLKRKHEYYGKAWYQKEVTIPKHWNNKNIVLTLERVLWESKVYVDGTAVDTRESLVGSHQYDLTKQLTPGTHLLTVRIDNTNQYPFINVPGERYPRAVDKEMAHGYTNHTQIKWNGILGDISLSAFAKAAPENLHLYPDFSTNTIGVVFQCRGEIDGAILFEIYDGNEKVLFSQNIEKPTKVGDEVRFTVTRPEHLENWDEFSPVLYVAKVTNGGESTFTTFGLREIAQANGQLQLNDKRIYLRGNLECVIFPLTGYPPMDKSDWATLMRQAKNYGLNHLRFHSWCPPKAAFQAADEAGLYLQVELPHWSLKVGEDEATTKFLYAEAEKILQDYGNHPSFVMMAMGNELQGDMQVLNEMTAALKMKDKRRLFATTSFSFQQPSGTRPEKEDEFFIAQWTDKGWIRGQGIFNSNPPRFDTDYSANMSHIEIPVVSHEIGQYSVYPDLEEISAYTGVLTPSNFVAVKEDLEKKGMIDLAPAFTQASGKLASILYKEEIERALKTPEFDGFQLLQLQDFPGQGTALVGLLNAFWKSKGIISGEEFRRFNSEVVPLVRFEKAVYTSGENFKAVIEVANFYKRFKNQTISWSIKTEGGTIVGESFETDLEIGNNQNLAKIDVPLDVSRASKLLVEVKLEGTPYVNSWSIWVYPAIQVETPEDVLVTSSFEKAKQALSQGRKVLLNPDLQKMEGIDGRFVPVFWSPVHFPDQPGTMGFLVDKDHPAMASFPTDTHTDWHWWDPAKQSKSIILDEIAIDPVVRVIDNFVTNHSLATVFETRVGTGKLVFVSIDISNNLDKRPVAKQLKYSLLEYMKTEAFHPVAEIKWEQLEAIEK